MIKKVQSTILLVLATTICTEGYPEREVVDELSGCLDSEGKLVWYDARLLGVEGKGWEKTEFFYDRLPVKAKGVVPEGIWELGHCSSGLLIRFDTDSENISIRWSLTDEKLEMPHMPATGVSGVDLYFRDENSKFRTCGYGRPIEQSNEVAITLPPSDEYILYLPLYNGVEELELGIPKGEILTKFKFPEASESIVFYGTSITQGGCASRPGMNATSIVGRELDRPIINLGFSGSARMEMEIAELLCDLNPAVFVLDSLWNMDLEMIAERAEPFVRKLRMERPTTPIILVEDSNIRNLPTAKGDLFRGLYGQLKSEGDDNIYMLSNTGMLGEDWEATVDGVHFTDLGMHRQAEVFVSALQGILAKSDKGNRSSHLNDSWLEIDNEVFGAKPDEYGPIGGGNGYSKFITKGDYTVKDLDSLLDALSKAKSGQTVFIPGETEIDLTARIYIDQLVLEVPEGVTLAGERGNGGSKGALLSSDALKTPIMISPAGPDVRITGLRIRGPNPKQYLNHHGRSFSDGGGGHEYYYEFPTSNGIKTGHPRLEVDNCEISAFAHGGIYLMKGDGHHIHHNYIHHCQYNGLGYGVCHDTASSLIEFNKFNWNRHSIAATGRPGSSYVARHNVEGGVSLSHCFDMHGGRDRKDGTNIAGTSIEIYNNTFVGSQTPVVIRGVPQETCEIHHNWFKKHDNAAHAVKGSEKTKVENNVYGDNPKAAK